MTLICFASQKGSPGTSAAALAVAAAYRPGAGRRKLLLEADLSGGALAIRYRLPTEPGLVTLAAAARAGLSDDELWRHAAELPGGLAAVLCPDGPEQVHSALAAAGGALGRHLSARRDLDVIADLGRLHPGSPAVELAAEATAVLMVARPTAEQLQPAAQRMLALRPRIKNLGWLLIGEKPHGPTEVESTFGFPVVGVLADDRRSVEAIEGGAVTRRVRRHPFVRSAATVASTLGTWLSPLADTGPAEAEVPPTHAGIDDEAGREREAGGDDEADLGADPAGPAPLATAPLTDDDRQPTGVPNASVRIAADDRAGRPAPWSLGPAPPPLRSAPIAGPNGGSGHDDSTVEPGPEPAAAASIDPPAPPAPPRQPGTDDGAGAGASGGEPAVQAVPDPFVHDDDDGVWTGTERTGT